ncbi:MAG: S41 family peptidase [Chloroherpetonaceae bacterium]|nr:S41 family peptidase [Chthonomonadaceae bacterium]MDW8209331.1 S41 family peptidase [Chloroherpetonaceae bacterium]
MRPRRRPEGPVLLLVLACAVSFFWGRHLGSRVTRPRIPGLPVLHRMLSADAEGAVGDGEFVGTGAGAVAPQAIFEDVLDKVQREFVETTSDTARLSNGALARMFASLDDPRTLFLDPPLRRARQEALMGRYQGIGATLAITRSQKEDVAYRHLSIVAVLPGSPAEKAGLKPGDRLTEIDGRWIIAYSVAADISRLQAQKDLDALQRRENLRQIAQKFQNGLPIHRALSQLMIGQGRSMRLTVQRTGVPHPLQVTLTTAATQLSPVGFRTLDGQIGYLRIAQFNRETGRTLTGLLDRMDRKMKGLVIDLRANPGGVRSEDLDEVDGVEPARALLARLTPGGKVALIERKPARKQPFVVPRVARPLSLPMVVLVDRGTAGLSELVAAALRDTAGARIVGTRTFGDGILPLFAVFKNGSGVEMTTARLFTIRGDDLAQGIKPDITVTEEAGQDAPLRRALALLET